MENYKNISVNSNIEDVERLDGALYKYLYDRIWSDAELLGGFDDEIKDIIVKTIDKFGAEINHFVAVALEKVANEKLNENKQGFVMKYEVFEEKFKELSTSERLSIFNKYCCEHGDPDKEIHSFDEEFFDVYFPDHPMEAARATFFGKIESWSDDYIKFNAYGNLESMNEYDVLEEIDNYLEEIYDNPDTWEDYIDNEEDDEEEDE